MATIKSFTSLDQSKKLAEILPLESADMWYHGHYSPWESERKYDDEPCTFHSMRPNWDKPCWSLAALLSVLPESYQLTSNKEGKVQLMLIHQLEKDYYDNPIDACYEMIIKLNELKVL